jgi:hypothetical protein
MTAGSKVTVAVITVRTARLDDSATPYRAELAELGGQT